MTTPLPVSNAEEVRIMQALRDALPYGPDTSIDPTKVYAQGASRVVPVIPTQYPVDKWAFMSGLAAAEIALRDAGMMVRLESRYAQRMLVVTGARGHRPFAYTTEDGNEYHDRAGILGIGENDPSWAGIEGYLYDTEADLKQVLEEARAEHPKADFSRVESALSSMAHA